MTILWGPYPAKNRVRQMGGTNSVECLLQKPHNFLINLERAPAPPPPPVRDTAPAAIEPVVVEETPPDVPTEYAMVVDQSPDATALVMVE